MRFTEMIKLARITAPKEIEDEASLECTRPVRVILDMSRVVSFWEFPGEQDLTAVQFDYDPSGYDVVALAFEEFKVKFQRYYAIRILEPWGKN